MKNLKITLLLGLLILAKKPEIHAQSYGTGLDGYQYITSTTYIDEDRANVSNIDVQNLRIYFSSYAYGKFTSTSNPFTLWTVNASQWDKFILVQMEGGNVGTYTIVDITQWDPVNDWLDVRYNADLSNFDFSTGSVVQIIRIPQYTTLEIVQNGIANCRAYDGHTGGVLMFMADTKLKVLNNGTTHFGIIDVSGKGYIGGNGAIGAAGALPSSNLPANGSSQGDNGEDADDPIVPGTEGLCIVSYGGTFNAGGIGGYGGNAIEGSPANYGSSPSTNPPDPDPGSLLTIGNGGAGGNSGKSGGAGGNGGGGGGAVTPPASNPNQQGSAGGDGGSGGNGGSGGGAIYIRAYQIELPTTSTIVLLANGGIGSYGTNGTLDLSGGKGGDGNNGDLGSGATAGTVDQPGGGGGFGLRGDGADGGNGGNGGNAGAIWLVYYSSSNASSSYVNLLGGAGGSGGTGAKAYPYKANFGDIQSNLDLLANFPNYAEYCPITGTALHKCSCDQVFQLLSTMENATYNANTHIWHFTTTGSNDECTYDPLFNGTTDEPGSVISCTTSVYSAATSTSAEINLTVIYECKTLLDTPNDNHCNDHFNEQNGIGAISVDPIGNYTTGVQSEFYSTDSRIYYEDDNTLYEITTSGPNYPCVTYCDMITSCEPDCPSDGLNGETGSNGNNKPNNFSQWTEEPVLNNIKTDDGNGFAFYPNPSSQKLVIELFNNNLSSATVIIYDITGKIVMSYDAKPVNSRIILDIKDLSNGLYQMKVLFGTFDKSVNFIKN